MNCPRCNKELKSVSFKGVTLDICEACDGVWFDKDELSVIINSTTDDLNNSVISNSLAADKNTSNVQSQNSCPKCGIPMKTYNYCSDSEIEMDKCSMCDGIWLDDGEIKDIINYIDSNTTQLPPEKISAIQSKLDEIENDIEVLEDDIVDDMVKSDERPGLLGVPGKTLQSIYKFFYKIGL